MTGSVQASLNFSALFLNYKAMSSHFNGTQSGSSYDASANYKVLYVGATTIKVNITLTSGGTTVYYTAHVLKNGTATSVYSYGYNSTGSQARGQLLGAMSPFIIFQVFSSPQLLSQFTSSQFVHATGQPQTVTIGPSTVTVTTYTANHLPLTISTCSGTSTFNKFTIQTGVVSGKTQTLVTMLAIDGTVGTGSGSVTYNTTFNLTSITTA
jgi:hypothetical protein